MAGLISTERIVAHPDTDAIAGNVVWAPLKSVWYLAHGLLGLVGLILYPQLDAALVFLGLSALTICVGHSVGMHRLLIHRSFQTFRFVEYIFVWLGTLVGMAGPIGMIRAHDMRDWHQRQSKCPAHPAHGASFFKDAWWQLNCEFKLTSPPEFVPEDHVSRDRFYSVLEKSWMFQQLPVALVLFWFGGWGWVLWGCSSRIFVSLTGHWMVGHFAHKRGQQGWRIRGLPVQGYNLPGFGLLTFGENWHGNHHAFPHSAQLGVEKGQLDLGYMLILFLQRVGLVWGVKIPRSEPERGGLERVSQF